MSVLYTTPKQQRFLNFTHALIVAKVVKRRKEEGATWLQHLVGKIRHARDSVKRAGIERWSDTTLRMKERLAGHIVRHKEQLAFTVLNFRSKVWWRKRQTTIRPGSREGRHPGRYSPYNWETSIVRKFLSIPPDHKIMIDFQARWGLTPLS